MVERLLGLRTILPNRRDNRSERVTWTDQSNPPTTIAFTVTVGFDRDLWVREVFAADFRPDGMVRFMMEDTCVLISLLLQHGYRLDDVVGKLARDKTASRTPLAALLASAAELERHVKNEGVA